MARERAKLTEKQERILVQCQLMGLTTRDMTQISNRLVALEREARYKQEIGEVVPHFTWITADKGWTITDQEGKVYKCEKSQHARGSRAWYERRYGWDITVTKPGTRFKEKMIKGVTIANDAYLPARLCPDNSKDLYGLLVAIKHGRVL